MLFCFFFQAEDGIRDDRVTGVQTCALPILEDFFRSVGAPTTLRELNVEEADIARLAANASTRGNFGVLKSLDANNILKIYKLLLSAAGPRSLSDAGLIVKLFSILIRRFSESRWNSFTDSPP